MPRREALIVGIDDYGGLRNNLTSCVNDARAMQAILREAYGFQRVTMLLDGDATIAGVDAALSAMFAGATPEDRLVFYYSGHGYQVPRGSGREEVLVLRDGYYEDNWLTVKTWTLPPGVLTVVIDSCFSGGMIRMITGEAATIEAARAKVWRPPPAVLRSHLEAVAAAPRRLFKGFARTLVDPAAPRVAALRAAALRPPALRALALRSDIAGADDKGLDVPADVFGGGDEVGQPELNGLLITASRENESASASTSNTEGLSAFTWALREALQRGAWHAPPRVLVPWITATLDRMSFFQMPMVLEPPVPGDLGARSFVLLEPPSPAMAASVLALLSEGPTG